MQSFRFKKCWKNIDKYIDDVSKLGKRGDVVDKSLQTLNNKLFSPGAAVTVKEETTNPDGIDKLFIETLTDLMNEIDSETKNKDSSDENKVGSNNNVPTTHSPQVTKFIQFEDIGCTDYYQYAFFCNNKYNIIRYNNYISAILYNSIIDEF